MAGWARAWWQVNPKFRPRAPVDASNKSRLGRYSGPEPLLTPQTNLDLGETTAQSPCWRLKQIQTWAILWPRAPVDTSNKSRLGRYSGPEPLLMPQTNPDLGDILVQSPLLAPQTNPDLGYTLAQSHMLMPQTHPVKLTLVMGNTSLMEMIPWTLAFSTRVNRSKLFKGTVNVICCLWFCVIS